MPELTDIQKRVYEYIKRYEDEYKKSPSYREIGGFMNTSAVCAFRNVKRIERKGYIKCYRKWNSITILK